MYSAPVEDISHALRHVAGLQEAMDQGETGELSPDLLEAILAEAARFAEERIAPLSASGDQEGTRLEGGKVTTPKGWRELYREWIDGGWNSLTGPEAHGGQGLPMSLAVAAAEMWNSASMSFAIGPALTGSLIDWGASFPQQMTAIGVYFFAAATCAGIGIARAKGSLSTEINVERA